MLYWSSQMNQMGGPQRSDNTRLSCTSIFLSVVKKSKQINNKRKQSVQTKRSNTQEQGPSGFQQLTFSNLPHLVRKREIFLLMKVLNCKKYHSDCLPTSTCKPQFSTKSCERGSCSLKKIVWEQPFRCSQITTVEGLAPSDIKSDKWKNKNKKNR